MSEPYSMASKPCSNAAFDDAREGVRRWLILAIGSLMLAGVFALLIVVARTPVVARFVGDPVFYKRCLVIHVDLSLVVWFYAFLGALFFLLPTHRKTGFLSRSGWVVSFAGIALLSLGANMAGAQPVLSNYVPMIDHPLFIGGLIVFAAGLLFTLLQRRLLPSAEPETGFFPLPPAAHPGIRAAAICVIIALLTFVGSWMSTPKFLALEPYYELLLWGGGHVLQFANVSAMLAVWIVLVTSAVGRSPMGPRLAGILFGVLVLPLLAAPLLVLGAATNGTYRGVFTTLMQFGIFPVVTIFLIACLRALYLARRDGSKIGMGDVRITGFAASAALTVLGFLLGAMIRGSTTLIPAHYHASIGAVTVSFMAVTYLLFEPLGLSLGTERRKRLAAYQPLLFGVGQMLFSIGFALAGIFGMSRKTFGAEQRIQNLPGTFGLGMMSLGGLVAVVGGMLFLYLVATSFLHRIRERSASRSIGVPVLTTDSPH